MTVPHATVRVDFGSLQNNVLHRIRQTMTRVTFGLAAAKALPDGQTKMPDVFVHMRFSEPLVASENVRQNLACWITATGLREGIEALEGFVNEVRFILGLQAERGLKAEEDTTLPRLLREARSKHLRDFERKAWKNKIGVLRSRFGLRVDLTKELLSINKVRNCLTHREGIVSEHDINDTKSNSLVLEYRCMEVVKRGEDAEEVLLGPDSRVNAGEAVLLKTEVSTKRFNIGDRIRLTAQEVVHIMMTLHAFGICLVKEAFEHGRRCGIPTEPPKPLEPSA